MESSIGTSHVVFRLADEEYALSVKNVSSIIAYQEATPVPRAPKGVLGVVNLRGRIIPVVDLLQRFRGVSFEPGPSSRIVVAEGAVGPVGIAVDSANEVTEIDPETIKPVPDGVLTPDTGKAFLGVAEREGSLLILLELDEAVPRSEYAGALAGADEEGDANG